MWARLVGVSARCTRLSCWGNSTGWVETRKLQRRYQGISARSVVRCWRAGLSPEDPASWRGRGDGGLSFVSETELFRGCEAFILPLAMAAGELQVPSLSKHSPKQRLLDGAWYAMTPLSCLRRERRHLSLYSPPSITNI